MKIIRFVFLLVLWFTTATLSAQNLKLFHEDVEVSNGEINIAEPNIGWRGKGNYQYPEYFF